MCKHIKIVPIIEINEKNQEIVYTTVCQDCFKEFVISPMSLNEYLLKNKQL